MSLIATLAPAHAHVGHDATISLREGLLHPLLGLDHLLAAVGVGLWAALKGGRARLAWPVAFVVATTLGALAAIFGQGLPLLEVMIIASVVALGAAIASGYRPAVATGAVLCAAFALAHGIAHGTEMASGQSAIGYLAGLIATTAALHAGGVVAGQGLLSAPPRQAAAGIALALAGVALAVA